MDLGESIAASTAVVTGGVALITLLRSLTINKAKNGAASKADLEKLAEKRDKQLLEKFQKVVYSDTCSANRMGCKAVMQLTQEHINEKFKDMKGQIKEGFEAIQTELKEIKKNG